MSCTVPNFCNPPDFAVLYPDLVGPTGPSGGPMAMISSIAALRAFSVSGLVTGGLIGLTGYANPGDGGQGVFYYDSTSVASDDGGSIIAPALGTGRWIRYVVNNEYLPQWFGAKCDGVTDDRTALIAAMNAASFGKVMIPSGTLIISAPLPAFSNSPSIIGSSEGASTIKMLGGLTIGTDIFTFSSCLGSRVRDIIFDANFAAVSSGYCSVLGFLQCTDFSVTGSTVKNYTVGGIGMNACSRGNITKNYITRSAPANGNIQTQSIFTTGAFGNCTDINIEDNVCIWASIQLTQIRGNIRGNYINGFKYGSGISTDADGTKSSHLSLVNNVITGGTGTDINGNDCQGIENWSPYSKIIGNTCYLNSGNGIFSAGAYSSIVGNTCYNNGQTTGHGNSGIIVYYFNATSSSARTVCSDNTCYDNQGPHTQTYGIYVSANATEVMLGPNNCFGNLTAQVSNNGTRTSSITPVLEGSTAWTPGTILTLANATRTITVNGAALGDFVEASFSSDISNGILTGYVSVANSVACILYNPTGGSIVLGAGTLRVRVIKPTNYADY